jgi:hypothetical protein
VMRFRAGMVVGLARDEGKLKHSATVASGFAGRDSYHVTVTYQTVTYFIKTQ